MSAALYSRTGLESSYASFEVGTKKDGVVSRAKGPSIVAAAKRLFVPVIHPSRRKVRGADIIFVPNMDRVKRRVS